MTSYQQKVNRVVANTRAAERNRYVLLVLHVSLAVDKDIADVQLRYTPSDLVLVFSVGVIHPNLDICIIFASVCIGFKISTMNIKLLSCTLDRRSVCNVMYRLKNTFCTACKIVHHVAERYIQYAFVCKSSNSGNAIEFINWERERPY